MSINQNFPEVSPSLTLDFANSRRLDPRITFTRSSTATYVGSNGLINTAPVDEARFDHDPTTGESLGLLIEESRTNNAFNSEQVNLWSLGEGSVSSNFAESPIGDQTADKWIPDITNNFHYPKLITTLSSTSSVTYSIYAKQAGYRYLLVNTTAGSSSGNAGPVVDLQDGVVVDNYAATYPTTVTDAGNGWWRIAFTYTGNGSNLKIDHNPLPTSTIATYTGDNTSGVLLWGVQLEEGSFPTSYIPTTSSTVTRAADVASIEGTNFSSWYNQSEGTVFADADKSTQQYGGSVWLNNNETVNRGFSIVNSSIDTLGSYYRGNDNALKSLAFGVANPSNKTAVAFKADSFDLAGSMNGSAVLTNTLTSIFTTNAMRIGLQRTAGGNEYLNCHIARLAYYPQRLTDSQLQNLTK